MANPWAHSRTENEFDTVEPRTERLNAYAVPGSGSDESLHDGWVDLPGLGYAPTLRISPVGEPDATRLYNGQYITTHPVEVRKEPPNSGMKEMLKRNRANL